MVKIGRLLSVSLILVLQLSCASSTKQEISSSVIPERNIAETKALSSDAHLGLTKVSFLAPALVEAQEPVLLAEQIVQRISKTCDEEISTKPEMPRSDLLMMVPVKHLSSILKYGFRNQHEVMASSATHNPVHRLQAESTHVMLGLPYNHKMREILPKYAFLQFHDERITHFGSLYGNIMFKFKDEVKRRSTWSSSDSLSLRFWLHPDRYSYQGSQLPLNTFQYDKKAECALYCEAQIWGPLTASHVERIYIPKNGPIPEELKTFGVDIYTYSKNESIHPKMYQAVLNDADLIFRAGTAIPAKRSINLTPTLEASILSYREANAEENIVASELYRKIPTKKLINIFTKEWNRKVKPDYFYSTGMLPAEVLSELSARSEDISVIKLLHKVLRTNLPEDANIFFHSVALAGLSERPFAEIRPYVLKILNSKFDQSFASADLLIKTALFIAIQQADDPEIAETLKRTRSLKEFSNKALQYKCKGEQAP